MVSNSVKSPAKSWENVDLLCQNKGDSNHGDSRAESAMGRGVHGSLAVKRTHAVVWSEVP